MGRHSAGAVAVRYATMTGPSPDGNQLWKQNSADMLGDAAQDVAGGGRGRGQPLMTH